MIGAGRIVLFSFLLLLSAATAVPSHVLAFGLDDVAARAAKLAASPYQKPSATLPKVIKALDYDSFRDIRFRPERAMWRANEAAVRGHVLPSRLVLRGAGRDSRDHRPGSPGHRVRCRHLRLRPEQDRSQRGEGAGVRRLPGALPGQHPGVQGRGPGRSWARATSVRSAAGPAVWSVRARAGHRHRGEQRRGIPTVRRVLDRAPAAGSQGAHHLRPARLAAGDRRLPLRAEAGRDDGARRRRPTVSAQERREAGFGAADEHVLLRRQPARPLGKTTGRRSTIPTGCSIRDGDERLDLAPARQPQAAPGDVVRADAIRPASA